MKTSKRVRQNRTTKPATRQTQKPSVSRREEKRWHREMLARTELQTAIAARRNPTSQLRNGKTSKVSGQGALRLYSPVGEQLGCINLAAPEIVKILRGTLGLGLTVNEFLQDAIRCLAEAGEEQLQFPDRQEKRPVELDREKHDETTITIGLTSHEKKALDQWAVSQFKNANAADVAHYAMWFALLNPEQFSRWLDSNYDYCKAEGIDQYLNLRSRVAARYRTSKLKLVKH